MNSDLLRRYLKFLFNLSVTGLLFGAGPPVSMTGSQLSTLLMIYGLGFAAVYGANKIADRPRCFLMEWVDPPFCCGH